MAGGVAFAVDTGAFIAGATGLLAEEEAGSSGLTAGLVIFWFFLSALETEVLAEALLATAEPSAPEAAAGSGAGCLSAFGFFGSGAFFAPGCASLPTGVTGMIEAILSFSTST